MPETGKKKRRKTENVRRHKHGFIPYGDFGGKITDVIAT